MGTTKFLLYLHLFFTMKFLALFPLVAVAAAFDQAWEDYKLEFDKHYTPEEEAMRYANWKKDTEEVLLHNAMYGHEFTQGVNALSDLTEEEYKQQYLSSLIVPTSSNATMHVADNEPIPNAVDWRSQGLVTPVKNQGQCGSCYSFSATGALEGQWKKNHGSLPNLSEQQYVDCSGRYGNYGCRGGWYQSCWRYAKDAGGNQGENSYRYTARQGRCKFNRGQVVATVRGYHDTRAGSENDLDPSLLPSMLLPAPSVATDLVSTTPEAAHPAVLATLSLLSDTEAKEAETTTWSRTRGQPAGEPVDTSRWPET